MKYKLGELCDVVSGGTPSRAITEFWEGGTIPWIKIGNIKGKYVGEVDEYITQAGLEGSSAKILSAGTILFTIFATLGEVGILTIKACTNQAIAGITIKNQSEALTDYLYYFLKSKKSHVTALGRGVAQNNINLSILRNFEVPIPALSTQKQIVDVLDKAEKIIEARQQQLQKLDELVKARFVEMFGDCVLNSKGWKTKRLGDIAEVGSSKRVFVEDLKESGIPFYRGTEIGALAEGKTVTPELFISKEHYAELCIATGAPNIGDLLMPSICPDGRIWVVNTEKPFYFKDGRVLWAHAIDDSYNPVFLLYTLKDRIMSDYSSIASGTTFAELKIFALKECHVFDVPLELQNQFAAFVNQTDKSKVAVQKALDEAQLLFDSLMQKYFG
jgi:type I restriction enzyme S subunit